MCALKGSQQINMCHASNLFVSNSFKQMCPFFLQKKKEKWENTSPLPYYTKQITPPPQKNVSA